MSRLLLAIVAAWAAAGCARRAEQDRAASPPPEAAAAEEHAEDAAGSVRIAPDMLRDLRITTARVEQRIGGQSTPVLAEVHVNEERYAEVSSPVSGTALRLIAGPGDAVGKGQPLVELASPELGRARGDQREAEARLALAEQSLERKRGLAAERIAPLREVQEAEAELRAAAAAVAAARAALESVGAAVGDATSGGGFTLKSPLAGTVLSRTIVQGQVVEPGRTLFKVGALDTLWLLAHASERDAVRVQQGALARVALPALPGRAFEARVTLVGREVDAASRTIAVRLAIANQGGLLRPGMSATAWLPVGEGTPLLSVPAASLQRVHDSWCVFVPRGDGEFEIRPVGRGRDLAGEVEILSGLAAGDTVVVEGAFLLKAEAEKAEGEGGHHDH
jgi:cobalt-zinc-cadmium efflux system membrane fusion protein